MERTHRIAVDTVPSLGELSHYVCWHSRRTRNFRRNASILQALAAIGQWSGFQFCAGEHPPVLKNNHHSARIRNHVVIPLNWVESQ